MAEHDQNQDMLPADGSRQESAQTSDAKADAADTAKANDDLSEADLGAVPGRAAPNPNWNPLNG